MRLNNNALIPAAALMLAVGLFSGCAANTCPLGFTSSSKNDAAATTAQRTNSEPKQSTPSDALASSDRASYEPGTPAAAGTRPTPRFRQQPRPPYQGQSAIIGLYGEPISYQPSTISHRPSVASSDYRTEPQQQTPHGRPNLSQVTFIEEGGCFDPTIDPTGEVLAFASTMHQDTANIYLKAVHGSTITQLTSDPADDVMPCFSPDGSRIAFASNRSGKWDIYMVSINGGPPIQLTDDADHQIHPTFSPDGQHIAYTRYSNTSGRWEIWTIDTANPGVRTFLDYGLFPQWSPSKSESKILFQRPRQRGSRYHGVWTIDFVDGEAKHPTEIISAGNAATINPSWSPDGKHITFVTVMNPDGTPSERPNRSDIWLIGVDGNNRVKLTDGEYANFQPIWSEDGRVYFVSDRSGVDNIWSVSAGAIEELSQPSGAGFAGVGSGSERPSGN